MTSGNLNTIVFCILLLPFVLFGQQSHPAETILTVTGEVSTPLKLTMADLQGFPRHAVRAIDYDKHEHVFDGVDVYRILSAAGIHYADTIEGKQFASSVVIVCAADGYQAVFTLAELDPTNSERAVTLSYQNDGKPQSAKDGLLRIISTNEKRHLRWVRQVQSFIVQCIK